MAELRVEGTELVLHLTWGEKAGGVHGDVRVPMTSVERAEILDDAHDPADHGVKIGERLPGVVEVGTMVERGKKIFAAVHHDTPRGIRVVLRDGPYQEWIVGCDDPEATVSSLGLPH